MFSSIDDMFGGDSDSDSDSEEPMRGPPPREPMRRPPPREPMRGPPRRMQHGPPPDDSDSEYESDEEYEQPRMQKRRQVQFASNERHHGGPAEHYNGENAIIHQQINQKENIMDFISNISILLVVTFMLAFGFNMKGVRNFFSKNIEGLKDDTMAMTAITAGGTTFGVAIFMVLKHFGIIT